LSKGSAKKGSQNRQELAPQKDHKYKNDLWKENDFNCCAYTDQEYNTL